HRGQVEEGVRLPLPDTLADLVENILQRLNVRRREAAAEVARSRRIGNAAGADGIEKVGVVATHFDILEVAAVAQRVVSDVEHVIGFVIGEMDLEKLQSLINRVDESKLTGEGVHGADAAMDDATGTLRDLIVD